MGQRRTWGVNLEVGWVCRVGWVWQVGWVWWLGWIWLVNADHPAGTPGTLVLFPVGSDRAYFGVERLLAGATKVEVAKLFLLDSLHPSVQAMFFKELEAKDVGGVAAGQALSWALGTLLGPKSSSGLDKKQLYS